MKTPLVYVAGPFSAADRAGVEANIANAVAVGLEVARVGGFPVIPHSNTSHPEFEKLQSYEFWIAGTLELLRRSDALILVKGWERSSGARGEKAEAERLGLPVFFEVESLAKWIAGLEAEVA